MVKVIAALIAGLVIATSGIAGVAGPHLPGGAHTDSPAGEPVGEVEMLRQLQEQYLTDRGIHLEDLSATMQAHLGLPQAEIGGVAGRCDLALMEAGEVHDHRLPADPEAALDAVIDELRHSGPASVQATLAFMDDLGNRIEWRPQELEGTNYLAIQTSKRLMVGSTWLTTALADPASVHGNIEHEVGGHLYYGDTLSCRIVDAAVGDSDAVDHIDLFWEFGYAESEIYAELKELPHVIEGGLGDDPLVDVADQVAHMRSVFPAEVAEALLDSMAHRFAADATLRPEALALFLTTIA